MTDFVTVIGIVFVVFTILAFPLLRSKDENERTAAAKGIVGGVWLVVTFMLGTVTIGLFYTYGLEAIYTYVGCWQSVLLLFVGVVALGYINRSKRRG